MSALTNPALDFKVITPSNTAVLQEFRGLYIGSGGDVTIKNPLGVSVTFAAIPTGTFMPVQGTMVMATGTSASSIVGLY